MGMTLTEKIIARHAGRDHVAPGDVVGIGIDLCMANDATMRLNIRLVEQELRAERLFDPAKVIIVMDHQVPADSPATAEVLELSQRFAARYGAHFFANEGICHQILAERFVEPGMLLVGADSHTNSLGALGAVSCGMGSTDIAAAMVSGRSWLRVPETVRVTLTGRMRPGVRPKDAILRLVAETTCSGLIYQAVEFAGDGVEAMEVPERFTLCNMTTECGAKSSMVQPDERTLAYIREQRGQAPVLPADLRSDPDAVFARDIHIDLSELEPMIAKPFSVDNVDTVASVKGTRIDQAFLGSCTNGRIEDLREAAAVLGGRRVAPHIRFLVTPASRTVYRQAMKEGLIATFLDAGAIINHPGCSACWGAHQGVLSAGQAMISTGNRNFRGRAGHRDSLIYLASPATVAASAIDGTIQDPREYAA